MASPTAPVTFNFVQTPDIASVGSLSADSEDDIWAVSVLHSSSLHFDGTSWKQVPMAKASRVNKVMVLSPTSVWAVGQKPKAKFSQIQHFNGSSWTVISSPHFKTGKTLHSLKAVSANSIFAVGASGSDFETQNPLVEHFDGTKWSVVPVPQITGGELLDIAVISPSDIWAVGEVLGQNKAALTMHFNGRRWTRIPAPVAGLLGVTALSTNDVWAVGLHEDLGPFIEHWDGKTWQAVPSPPINLVSELASVSALSPTDVWAVGCTECGDAGLGQPPLIEHWNGTSWTVNPAPVEDAGVSANTIVTFPSGHIVIAGFAFGLLPSTAIMEGAEAK